MNLPHEGQECMTSCAPSKQNGMRQQPSQKLEKNPLLHSVCEQSKVTPEQTNNAGKQPRQDAGSIFDCCDDAFLAMWTSGFYGIIACKTVFVFIIQTRFKSTYDKQQSVCLKSQSSLSRERRLVEHLRDDCLLRLDCMQEAVVRFCCEHDHHHCLMNYCYDEALR